MVSLPKNQDFLNRMLLHIDIELIEWISGVTQSKKLLGLGKKTVKINEIIENGELYTAVTKYRKTVNLCTYNNHPETLLYVPVECDING